MENHGFHPVLNVNKITHYNWLKVLMEIIFVYLIQNQLKGF